MKKFTKVLSVVLAVILSVNTFSIGAFAAVTPPPSGPIVLTKDNLKVDDIACDDMNNIRFAPVVSYLGPLDGTPFTPVVLRHGIDYDIRYKSFQSRSDAVTFEIIGKGDYVTKEKIIKTVNVTSSVGDTSSSVGFYVAMSGKESVPDSDTKGEARTFTYLDDLNFVAYVPPNAKGTLEFFLGTTPLHADAIPINGKQTVNFSYSTASGLIPAGDTSKHFAVRVVWTDENGKKYNKFIVGITLNPYDLSLENYEDIPKKALNPAVPYTPDINIKKPKYTLKPNVDAEIIYYNNTLESTPQEPATAVVRGISSNFIGTSTRKFELFLDQDLTSGIECDRYDKTYTYGDTVVFTAYVRSGVGSNDTARFVCNGVPIGYSPVKYDGKNGVAVLNYKTAGKEFLVYDETNKLTNTITVEFTSTPGRTASVSGIIMKPKKIDMVVHCKDKVFDGTRDADIPTGAGSKNYTFVGKVVDTDFLKVEDHEIGNAQFINPNGTLGIDSDYYAGNAKPTRASGFTVTGKHAPLYIFPEFAYGTARISKKYDPRLKLTTDSVVSTYVFSSDREKFPLSGIALTLDSSDEDPHIGELDFKVNTVVDIDRGGIFEGNLEVKDKAIEYKVKDVDVENPAQKASLSLVVSSTNYTDIMTNINFTLMKKKWAKIDGYSVASKVYDGMPAVLQGKASITSEDNNLLVASKDLVFAYVSADGGTYNATQPPLLPGKYYAVITLPKTAYGYFAKTSIPFTIEKANITITTPSFEIYQGQEKLPEIPITFTGFVNKETVAIFTTNTLKAVHSTPDTLLPGNFVVGFTGEVTSDKYSFTYAPGTLKIAKVTKYPAVDPIPEKVLTTSVYLPKASYPEGILSFEELALSINAVVPSDDRLITQVMQQKSGFKNYRKMDIKLIEVLTGNAVQPKGKVTISIPYPDKSDSTMNFKVLHLYKNSTKIEMITPTKVVGGLQFQVSEFSAFVIGWEKPLASEDTDFFITNAQIKTEKKQFTVAVREDARKASFALTKFFEASTNEKSVIFNNPDVTITFERNALSVKEVMSSYDFYATKNSCEHEVAARAAGGEAVIDVVHFNHQGYWPGVAKVRVNVGEDRKGEELAYYYFHPDTGTLEYSTKGTVDKDGWFTVDQDHCSDYVISSEFPKVVPVATPSPTPEVIPEVDDTEKPSFLDKAWSFIKGIPAFVMALPGNVKSFISNASATFGNISKTASEIFKNVTAFFTKVTSPVAKIFGKVGAAVGGVFDGVKKAVGGVFDKIGGVVDGVKETVGGGVETVKENPFLFVGAAIAMALVVLIGFVASKIIRKKKSANGYADGNGADDYEDVDELGSEGETVEAPIVEDPPKTAAEIDDSIEY